MGKRRKKMMSILLTAGMALGSMEGYVGVMTAEAAVNLADGLVGYWTFDGDTEEERLANHAANASCSLAKAGNGVTVKNDGGVSGGSVYFGKQADSCLKMNQANLNASEGDFTLAAWVQFADENFTENQNLFQQNGNGRTILYLNAGKNLGTYLTAANVLSDETVTLGTWNHIAVTSDHATKKVQFYLNGRIAGEHTQTGSFVNAATDIWIGNHKGLAANTAVKGSMDEIRYYNKIVDADTIKAMYDEFSDDTQLDAGKEELEALIAQAKDLKGGTEAAQTALQTKIAEAEDYLKGSALTADGLTDRKTQLQTAISDYQKTVAVTIAVNTKDVIRDIPSAMFGINHRYHKDGYGSWDRTTDSVVEEFNELVKKANFGSVRYPGGTVANLFTWKDSIGPKEERTTVIGGNNFYSTPGELPIDPVFGVDEAMQWIYEDLNSEAIFVYGLGRGNPADAADLVEYLNAPNDGSNPNGGVDWAAVRAENGHEEPYGVVRFEIGNEYSDTGQDYWMSGKGNLDTTDVYIDGGMMNFTGQTSYFQKNDNVCKKGDWRLAASNSDGKPGEERYVYYLPVKEGSVTVKVAGTPWTIVNSLDGQGAANVCTFDYETGKITFGDGTNGNIPAAGAKISVNYQSEQAGFVQYYDAMKKTAEEIGCEIEVYSGIVDRLQRSFITKMHQKGYDDKYDGVIIHPYIGCNGTADYENVLIKGKQNAANIASHKELMETTTGDDTKKVAVSEFGINSGNDFVPSLGCSLYVANLLVDCVNAGAAYQNKHCLIDYAVKDNLGNWQQCVIQCHEQDGGVNQYVATPGVDMFSMFHNMTGNAQVDQTITGNSVYCTSGDTTVEALNVYSTKDDAGNTYVMAINNKRSEETAVKISVDGRDLTGNEIEIWHLGSQNLDDRNTLQEPNKVGLEKTSISAAGNVVDYVLSAHSITCFKIPAEIKMASVSVSASAGGTAEGSQEAEVGSEVTVTANPKEGYEFDGWYHGTEKVSQSAVYCFVLEESVALTARFRIKEIMEGGIAEGQLQSAVTADSVAFSWAAVNKADGYTVEVKDRATGVWKEIKTVAQTSYEEGNLVPNTTYEYRIRAYRMIDGSRIYFEGAVIKTIQTPGVVTPPPAPVQKPAAPKGLKLKKTAKGLKLSWKKVSGANGYMIYRSYKKGKGFKKIATIKKGGIKTYLDKKAKKGKISYYKVKAFKKSGNQKLISSYSKVVKKKR